MKEDIHPKMYLYRRVVAAKLYIDTQYAQKIDLNKIADQAYFSKYHFLRLFKQTYGKSPYLEAMFKDDSGNWFSLVQQKL